MEHRQASSLLPDLAADALDAEERQRLLRHVAGCDECRDWLETYELLADALAGERQDHPASELLARQAVDPALLSEPDRGALRQHLAACTACRQAVALTTTAVGQARPGRSGAFVRLKPAATAAPMARRWALAAALILAAGLAFVLTRPAAVEPAANRQLLGERLNGDQLVEATGSITAESVSVAGGGEVTFRAGDTVSFSDGFTVGADTTFRVEIGGAAQAPAVEEPTDNADTDYS